MQNSLKILCKIYTYFFAVLLCFLALTTRKSDRLMYFSASKQIKATIVLKLKRIVTAVT